MSEPKQNISRLDAMTKETEEQVVSHNGQAGASQVGQTDDQAPSRNLSKISLVISMMSLVLVAIFFFGLNRNMSGLTHEVQSYNSMKNNVESLDAYVDDLLSQMGKVNAQLLDMDEKRREAMISMLMQTMVQDMLQKTSYLKSQLGDRPEAAKLEEVRSILEQLQTEATTPAQ